MIRIRLCLLSPLYCIFLLTTTVLAADLIIPSDPPLNSPPPIAFESDENIIFDSAIINNGADITADAGENIVFNSAEINGGAVVNLKPAFEVKINQGTTIKSGARFVVTIKDKDGMSNRWEVDHCGTLNFGPEDDPDLDSLTMMYEYQSGYHPCDPDTDSDGMPDGWEDQYTPTLNVTVNDAVSDPDNDGLINVDEFENGTDPTNADTDGDGMPDGYEVLNGLNPLVDDADSDLDGDGFSNIQEFTLGTVANDVNSKPIQVNHQYDENGNLVNTVRP